MKEVMEIRRETILDDGRSKRIVKECLWSTVEKYYFCHLEKNNEYYLLSIGYYKPSTRELNYSAFHNFDFCRKE